MNDVEGAYDAYVAEQITLEKDLEDARDIIAEQKKSRGEYNEDECDDYES